MPSYHINKSHSAIFECLKKYRKGCHQGACFLLCNLHQKSPNFFDYVPILAKRFRISTSVKYIYVCVCFCVYVPAQSCPALCNPMDCMWLTHLHCPWGFPGKNTGVGCCFLLQGIFPIQGSNLRLLCLLPWQAGSLLLSSPGKPQGPLSPGQKPAWLSAWQAECCSHGGRLRCQFRFLELQR